MMNSVFSRRGVAQATIFEISSTLLVRFFDDGCGMLARDESSGLVADENFPEAVIVPVTLQQKSGNSRSPGARFRRYLRNVEPRTSNLRNVALQDLTPRL